MSSHWITVYIMEEVTGPLRRIWGFMKSKLQRTGWNYTDPYTIQLNLDMKASKRYIKDFWILASVWVISLQVEKVPFWLCPLVWIFHQKSVVFEIRRYKMADFDTEIKYQAILNFWIGSEATEAEFHLCSESFWNWFFSLASEVA